MLVYLLRKNVLRNSYYKGLSPFGYINLGSQACSPEGLQTWSVLSAVVFVGSLWSSIGTIDQLNC